MVDWIAKGPIQVLNVDLVHDRNLADHLDWLLQRKRALALEGTRAATYALGRQMFKSAPADGFVARMTEWFAGTPDGPTLTGLCKQHAYAPYEAARTKVHAQFDEMLRQEWIRKVQKVNARAARNLTADYTKLLGVRCLTREDIDAVELDLCKRVDCYFKDDPDWDILVACPEPPVFSGRLAQDEDELRKATFDEMVKQNADRASLWSFDFQTLVDGKRLTPDDIVALKQDFFDRVGRNFKEMLYPLALQPELTRGVPGGEEEAASKLPGKRTGEGTLTEHPKKRRTDPANPV